MTSPAAEPRAPEPGLAGVVPFRFACHRCGHCCTAGDGYVWLTGTEEVERLAARLGTSRAAFEREHVRTVVDPATGAARLALRETNGRCSLLEGTNRCTVYAERPAHCATFPFWPSVLADEHAFERARAVCPGIAVEVDAATRARAFARLEALYAEFDAHVESTSPVCTLRGTCCRFEQAGHRLYATALEADYCAAVHPDAPPPEAQGRCPYHVAGRCTARVGRPLGCRSYFCDAASAARLDGAHERFLARVRSIERETGYPAAYGAFPALLAARGVGATTEADAEEADA